MFRASPPAEPAHVSPKTTVRPTAGQSTAPQTGDVVVRKEADDAGPRYTVRQVPGEPQVSCGSRDAAMAFASAFARRHRVDVWEECAQMFALAASERGKAERS